MTAYYNEHDPKAAAWLRELIKQGHIADGVVDERSIEDVLPSELAGFTQCHFFAGIGGWSYALRLAGWPDDKPVWTGSCPCQPFSAAGKGGGTADERHLWPAFHWLIAQCRPPVVFGEQVASKAGRGWFGTVRSDLEELGYAVGAADLCAAGVGAPHIRQRLYFVADADAESNRRERQPHLKPAGVFGAAFPATESRQQSGSHRATPSFVAESDSGQRDGRAVASGRHQRDGQDAGRAQGYGGAAGSGEPGFVADRDGSGPLPRTLPGVHSSEESAGARHGEPERCGPDGILADALPTGRPQGRASAGRGSAAGGGGARDLGHPSSPGLAQQLSQPEASRKTGRGNARQAVERAGAPTSFWTPCDWLPCRDGKARPVEPGTFPLAHGLPARVGRLRGYGNAIVPQVAAAFIEASGV